MSNDVIWIWTIQMARWRYAKDLGLQITDITVKSGIQAFSPTWEDLYEYRRGQIGMLEYSRRYHEKMMHSLQTDRSLWDQFLNKKDIVLGCYCPAGNFCHRYLFTNLLVSYLQQNGRTVEYKGELIPHPNNDTIYQHA